MVSFVFLVPTCTVVLVNVSITFIGDGSVFRHVSPNAITKLNIIEAMIYMKFHLSSLKIVTYCFEVS